MIQSRRRRGIRTTRMAAIGLVTMVMVAGNASAGAVVSAVPRQTIIPTPAVGGRLALFKSGRFQGYLARLAGCSIGAVVVGPDTWSSVDLSLGKPTSTPCVLDHGRIGRAFMAWLDDSLRGSADPTTLLIASYSSSGVPLTAIELRGATLTGLELPGLDASSLDTVVIRSTLVADEIQSVKAPSNPGVEPKANSTLHRGTFQVEIEGSAQPFVRTVSGLELDALFGEGIRDPRDRGAVVGVFHPGELLISVGTKGRRFLEEWLDRSLLGEPQERSLSITYTDDNLRPLLVIELRGVGISGADAGLDPVKRAFGFYVEGVSISFPAT